MKTAFLFFLLLLVSFNVVADVYKYKDEKGRVYFVDSIYKVPLNYKKSVEILPSGKDINQQEEIFFKAFLAKDKKVKFGDLYFNFILEKTRKWVAGILLIFGVVLLIILFQRDFFWGINYLVILFLLTEVIYIFVVYPEVREATRVYSYLTRKHLAVAFSVSDRVKKHSLENSIIYKPIPLNPYKYFRKVILLKEFYNKKSIEVLIEEDK